MSEKQVTPVAANDREQRQREFAYQLWEEEGRPEGKAEEHWSKAGLMLLDLEAQAPGENAPDWLRKGGLEPLAKEMVSTSAIDELRERVKKRVA